MVSRVTRRSRVEQHTIGVGFSAVVRVRRRVRMRVGVSVLVTVRRRSCRGQRVHMAGHIAGVVMRIEPGSWHCCEKREQRKERREPSRDALGRGRRAHLEEVLIGWLRLGRGPASNGRAGMMT